MSSSRSTNGAIRPWNPREHADDLSDACEQYANAGGSAEREAIFGRIYPELESIARKAARRYTIPNLDRDDVQQEIMLAFTIGLTRYSRDKGAARAFAYVIAERKATDLLRKATNPIRHRPAPSADEQPEVEAHAFSREREPVDPVAEDDELHWLREQIALLDESERELIDELLKGRTIQSIADDSGVNVGPLHRRRQKVIAKLGEGRLLDAVRAKNRGNADTRTDDETTTTRTPKPRHQAKQRSARL